MPKVKGTYAIFDVAKEKLLRLISDWRQENMGAKIGTMTGTFSRCTSAGDQEMKTWRKRKDTLEARLISISSHGADASVSGCQADLYMSAAASTYPETAGAVMHLLACESLTKLAGDLVKTGKADAVIGYLKPFSFFLPSGNKLDALPDSTIVALECDAQVLAALANGKTVEEAVAHAKAWAAEESARLTEAAAVAAKEKENDALLDLAWKSAVLNTNAEFLDFRGKGAATVTS